MNKQGFASLYVLAILQIILAFVMLLVSSSKTVLANKNMSTDLHEQQLYALYHVKAYMKQDTDVVEDMQTTDEEVTDEEQNTTQEEIVIYRNQEIHITYQPTQVDILVAHLHMQLEIDEETKSIMNLVYL